jgi:hypothetical protein
VRECSSRPADSVLANANSATTSQRSHSSLAIMISLQHSVRSSKPISPLTSPVHLSDRMQHQNLAAPSLEGQLHTSAFRALLRLKTPLHQPTCNGTSATTANSP